MAALLLNSSQTNPGFKSLSSSKRLLYCCFSSSSTDDNEENVYNEVDQQNKHKEIESAVTEEDPVAQNMTTENIPDSQNENTLVADVTEQAQANIEDNTEAFDEMDGIADQEMEEQNKIENNEEKEIKPERKQMGELRVRVGMKQIGGKNVLGNFTAKIVDAIDFARPSTSADSVRDVLLQPQKSMSPDASSDRSSIASGSSLMADVPPVLAYSVHTVVLPAKRSRFKTKMRQGPDPYFDEMIKIPRIRLEDAKKWTLRFRLYGSMRNSMHTIIGEGYLPLDLLDFESRTQCKLALLSYDTGLPEDTSSTLIFAGQCQYDSMTSLESLDRAAKEATDEADSNTGPELLIGLMYNFNSGRLTVEIIKGSRFPRTKDGKPNDVSVKVALVNNRGEQLETSKTAVKKSSTDPEFDETFVFHVMAYQMNEINISITGCIKHLLSKSTPFGSFTIGNKGDTEEEILHWKDLIETDQGNQILRWHSFVMPKNNEQSRNEVDK